MVKYWILKNFGQPEQSWTKSEWKLELMYVEETSREKEVAILNTLTVVCFY